ncbi:NUDIX hydrolase [Kineosporia succinea]|uniref:8-oxo-dGTP pyrophosphatase MutT (NUDIX family) n=1 Tax=Kineosporia succinea TaxID=84632 RepID=A0ABT9P2E5_9ACTN|nr:NUDIX domain-containing protein [Kineosporia succinea]MDP9826851.1 8-oxo-dGTP pyrophosphatase MutT (NUDIX family) [Kineosporia succinea]
MITKDVQVRRAARVILTDPDGRVLLFEGNDPGAPEKGRWWVTPGGGADAGETLAQTAARELFEETGFVVTGDLGAVVLERRIEFVFMNRPYEQHEVFFRAVLGESVTGTDLDRSGWTEIEKDTMTDARWWTADELRATTETVYPAGLADLL